MDGSGNLYLADTHNQRVRRVDVVTGTISTVAGTGLSRPGLPIASGDSGPASLAMLALPRGLAAGAAGDLYIADTANQRIRRIAPDGTITTVAGQGTEGSGETTAHPARPAWLRRRRSRSRHRSPTVADAHNARLRQVSSVNSAAPEIETVVGPGASLSLPRGILSLTGASTVTYGSGSLTATLNGAASAGGSVIFVESSGGTTTPVGNVSLVNGAASLATSGLSAGLHMVTARYAGNGPHAPSQSQPFMLTVMPLQVTAFSQPAPLVYGQPVPVLTGASKACWRRTRAKCRPCSRRSPRDWRLPGYTPFPLP